MRVNAFICENDLFNCIYLHSQISTARLDRDERESVPCIASDIAYTPCVLHTHSLFHSFCSWVAHQSATRISHVLSRSLLSLLLLKPPPPSLLFFYPAPFAGIAFLASAVLPWLKSHFIWCQRPQKLSMLWHVQVASATPNYLKHTPTTWALSKSNSKFFFSFSFHFCSKQIWNTLLAASAKGYTYTCIYTIYTSIYIYICIGK